MVFLHRMMSCSHDTGALNVIKIGSFIQQYARWVIEWVLYLKSGSFGIDTKPPRGHLDGRLMHETLIRFRRNDVSEHINALNHPNLIRSMLSYNPAMVSFSFCSIVNNPISTLWNNANIKCELCLWLLYMASLSVPSRVYDLHGVLYTIERSDVNCLRGLWFCPT